MHLFSHVTLPVDETGHDRLDGKCGFVPCGHDLVLVIEEADGVPPEVLLDVILEKEQGASDKAAMKMFIY